MIFGDIDVLYDTGAKLFKLWYNTPSCPGVDGAYVDLVYRSSADGLEWPLPNLSIVPRRNVTATGGDAVGRVPAVPNVVLPCSGAIGIWHEPDDVDCPFKAFGQFNFNFTSPVPCRNCLLRGRSALAAGHRGRQDLHGRSRRVVSASRLAPQRHPRMSLPRQRQ